MSKLVEVERIPLVRATLLFFLSMVVVAALYGAYLVIGDALNIWGNTAPTRWQDTLELGGVLLLEVATYTLMVTLFLAAYNVLAKRVGGVRAFVKTVDSEKKR